MPATDYLSAADVAEFRVLVDDARPDPYEVLRRVVVSTDDMGQDITDTAVVEVGMCTLLSSGLTPREQVTADQLGWAVPYVAELPFDTLLWPSDQIRIGGRTFEVGGVGKEANWGLEARAVLNEVGP